MHRREILLLLALVVACTLIWALQLPPAVAAKAGDGGGAVVSVEGTRPLGAGTMGENAHINTNRDYSFVQVPEFLRGLQFTSHRHNTTAKLTCTVKAAGQVYLCLQKPATPRSLKLAGKWEAVGKMDTIAFGRSYPWTIHRTDVKAGDKLTIPSPDRWGAVLAVKKIDGLKTVAPARPQPKRRPARSAAPADEYAQLAGDIRNRAWSNKIAK